MTFHEGTAKSIQKVLEHWKSNVEVPVWIEGQKFLLHPVSNSLLLKRENYTNILHTDGVRDEREPTRKTFSSYLLEARIGIDDHRGSGACKGGTLGIPEDPDILSGYIHQAMDGVVKNAATKYMQGVTNSISLDRTPFLVPVEESKLVVFQQTIPEEGMDPALLEGDILEAVRRIRKELGERVEKIFSQITTEDGYSLYVDTEGSVVQRYNPLVTVELQLLGRREDDEIFVSNKRLLLPGMGAYDQKVLESKVDELMEDFEARKDAVRINGGSYPILMAGSAVGILFHEAVAAHLLSGKYIAEDDSTIYAGRLGTKIMPPYLTIVDDPTIAGGLGSYPFDDEGVKAQKVVLVRDGILENYLLDKQSAGMLSKILGRTIYSNGRARSQLGVINTEGGTRPLIPEPRVTNLIITSSQLSSEDEMYEELQREMRESHSEFGLVVGGGGGQVNCQDGNFRQIPRQIWRVDAKGNKVLVEGAYPSGQSDTIFNMIAAVGEPYADCFGICGAPGSGGVPTQERAPAMLFKGMSVVVEPYRKMTRRLLPI